MISPVKFKEAVSKTFTSFGGKRQQDAHEFLILMLDKLRVVKNKFLGRTLTQVVCVVCKKISSERSEDFSCLSVYIPAEKYPVSLSRCIEEFMAEELIIELN